MLLLLPRWHQRRDVAPQGYYAESSPTTTTTDYTIKLDLKTNEIRPIVVVRDAVILSHRIPRGTKHFGESPREAAAGVWQASG